MQPVKTKAYGTLNFPDEYSREQIKTSIDDGIKSGKLQTLEQRGISAAPQQSRMGKYIESAAQSPATQFVLGAGDEFVNSFKNIANIFAPESMQSQPTRTGSGAAYDIGNVAGEIGAFTLAGPAARGATLAAESLPIIGKLAAKIGGAAAPGIAGTPLSATGVDAVGQALGGGAGIAQRALGGGLWGASQSPEERASGFTEMAAGSAGIDALLGGMGKLRPSRFMRGQLSPAELMENIAITKGTETGLGDVIQSPMLKKQYENVVSEIPFSGVDDQQARTANIIKDEGEKILDKYLGDEIPETVTSALGKELTKAHKVQEKIKRDLYKPVEKLSDDLGIGIKTKNFGAIVNDYKDLINQDVFLENMPIIKKQIKEFSGYDKGLMEGATKLKKTNLLASSLNRLSKQYYSSPNPADQQLSGIFGDMGKSLKRDIHTSLGSSERPDLLDMFITAEENYGKQYSPFLDKNIHNFTRGDKDVEDLIPAFLKTSANTDKGALLDKLMTKLPPKGQDLVKYSYLSRALDDAGKLKPLELSTLLGKKKIGPKQKKALFRSQDEIDDITRVSKLAKMNTDAVNRMFNPMTGKRAQSAIPGIISGIAGTAGGYEGYDQGGIAGAAGGSIGLIGLAGLLGRGSSKALTSERIRKSLVDAMVKGNESIVTPWVRSTLKPALGRYMRDE